MQNRLIAPPCFVVEVVVLGKPAHIHNSELRVDGGPAVGGRLAAVVEAGPGKATRQPFSSCIEFPPLFGKLGPEWMIQVICAEPVAQFVGFVNTTSGNRARGL